MGRIDPVRGGDGSRSASPQHRHQSSRLRDHGALAGVDSSSSNRYRNDSIRPPTREGRKKHLTELLAPLADDSEQLAARLLAHFGSIGAIGGASEVELRRCATYGERWIDIFLSMRMLLQDGLREEVLQSQLMSDDKRFHAYLHALLGYRRHETMRAFFADEAHYLICEEDVAQGDDRELRVSSRRIFSRALAVDARRIVLAHNHPSGSLQPSRTDILQTKELVEQAKALGISIDDHLIVGKRGVVSMRARGLM